MLLGACKPYRKIGALIGALPVGLKGKIYGQPFKVLIQYDAFGGVKAQIYEDEQGGGMITEVTGRKGEVKPKAEALSSWAISRAISQGLVSKGGEAKVKVRSWFEGKSIDEDFDEATIDIKELKKDIDGSIEKLLKKLKVLRLFESLSLLLVVLNIFWLIITSIYDGSVEIKIMGASLIIPDYLPREGSYIFLGSAVVFIASTATGFIQKNKVFGSSLTIYEIKENIETILIEFYNLNSLIEHLSDWSNVAHETIEKPFIDSGQSLKSLSLLRDIETKSKAFQIAEGEINEVVINNISNKYVKIGWMKELFQKTLESFKTWTIEQNLAFGSTLDFNKKLFKDVSNLPTVGPRRKIREYAESGFITINGRKSLEAFIEKELGGVGTSEIFSKNITIVENRGEKSSDVDKFFGDLSVEHKWDKEFLSGVWTNVKLVNEPENVVVDTTAISGKQESENSAVQYMDLEIAVKAGTPVQSLYLRVDLSKPQKPSAVGEWNRSTLSNEFKELDQNDNEIY